MSKLRRYPAMGRPYFITNVTFNRLPVLIDHVDLLWAAFKVVDTRSPFELIAWVALPDHFHIVIDTRANDASNVLQRIKMSFAASLRRRLNQHAGRVWQHRFWDHIIRDRDDLKRHLDYIHFNPVKHAYVDSPFDWSHSSIHRFRQRGVYGPDWGVFDPLDDDGEYGE